MPLQQIFEVNQHNKYRFLSEGTKRTICNTTGYDNPNFVKLPGRKSVKKEERTPTKVTTTNILPFKIRGNESVKEDRQKHFKKKYSKEVNSVLGDRFQEHPMIINQMNNPKTASRLSENPGIQVLTPRSTIRDQKSLKTTKSYNSNTAADSNKVVSDLEISSLKVDKNKSYLKRKIAYEFNIKDYFTKSDKVRIEGYMYSQLLPTTWDSSCKNKRLILRN